MVLKQHNTLRIKLAGDLPMLLVIDVVKDLIIDNTNKGLLKETHGKL